MADINWIPGNQNGQQGAILYMDIQPPQVLDIGLSNLLFGPDAPLIPAVPPFLHRPVPMQPFEVDTLPIPRVAGVPDWGLRAYVLANQEEALERFCVDWLVQYFGVAQDAQGNAVNVLAAPHHYRGIAHEIPAWLPNQFYPVPGQNPAAPYIFPNGQAAHFIGQFVQFNGWNADPAGGPILVLEESHWVWDNVHQPTPVARSLSSANDHVRKGEAEDWLEAVEYFAKLKLKSRSAAAFKQGWEATKKKKKGTNVENTLQSLSDFIAEFLGMTTHKLLAYCMRRTGKSLDQCAGSTFTLFVANTPRGSPTRPFEDAMLTRSAMTANGGSSKDAKKKWDLIDARLYPVPVVRAKAYSRNDASPPSLEARGEFLFAPVSLQNETQDLEAAFLEAILTVVLESPTFSSLEGSKLVFAGDSPKIAMGGEDGSFIQNHKDRIVITAHISHEFYTIQSRKLQQKVSADSMVRDFERVLKIIENYGVNNPDKDAVHHSAVDVLHDIYKRAGMQAPNCPPPRSLVTASKARASFALGVMDEFLPAPSHGHCPAPRNQRRQAASVPTASQKQHVGKVGKVVRHEPDKVARSRLASSRPWGLHGKKGILLTKSNQQQPNVVNLPAFLLESNSGQRLALLLEKRKIAYDCMTCCFTLESEPPEPPKEASTARTADMGPFSTTVEGLAWKVNSQVLRSAVDAQQELFEQGCMIFAPMAKLLTMLRQCLTRGQCLQKPLLVKAALNKSASRLDLSVYEYEYAEGGTNDFPLFWHGENNCDEAFWDLSPAAKRIGFGIADGGVKKSFRRSFFDGLKTRGALRTQSLYKHRTANKRTFVEHRNGTIQQAQEGKNARAYIAPNPELFSISDNNVFLHSCLPVSTKVGNETRYQSYRPLVVSPTGAIKTTSERLACKSEAEFRDTVAMTGGWSFQKESSGKKREERRLLHSEKGAPFGSRPAVQKRTNNPFQGLESCTDDDDDDDHDDENENEASPQISSNAVARARAYVLNATEKVDALPPHLIERPREIKGVQHLVPQPKPNNNGTFTRKHHFTLTRKLAGPKHQLKGVLSAKRDGASAEKLRNGMAGTLKKADDWARKYQAELGLARRDAIDLRDMQASIKVSLNQAFVRCAMDQRKDSVCAKVCAQVNIISGQLQRYLGQPVGSAELAQGQVAQPGDHDLIEEEEEGDLIEEEEEGEEDFVEEEVVKEGSADGDDDRAVHNPFADDEDEEELRLDRSYGLAGSKFDIVRKLKELLDDIIFHFDDQKLKKLLFGSHLDYDDNTPASFSEAVAQIRQVAALSYDLSRAEAFPAPIKKDHKLLKLFRALDDASELNEAQRLFVIRTELDSVPQERLRYFASSLLPPDFDQMKVERATEQQQQGGTVASADEEKDKDLEWHLTFNHDGSVVCDFLQGTTTAFAAPGLTSSLRPHMAIQLFKLLNAQAPTVKKPTRVRKKPKILEEDDTTGLPKEQAHKIRYEEDKVTLAVTVKSDFKAIIIARRLRFIVKLLCKKKPVSVQGICNKLDAVGAAGLTLQAVTGIGCDFFVTKELIKSSVAQILCVKTDRKKALGTELVIPNSMLNAAKSQLVDMLEKVRTARAPKRASLPLPDHGPGRYQLFASTGSQNAVENSVITLDKDGYKAETDQILLVYGLAASFSGSTKGTREELYFGNRMEIVLPKGSFLKIGAATLFPYLVHDHRQQSHLACGAHVAFSIMLPSNAYANVSRKNMRCSLLSAVRESTNCADERQQSPATSFPPENTWAETVASNQVQQALKGIDESSKTTRCKERAKVQIAKRLALGFDAAHQDGQTPRGIPAEMRIGKGQKTLKEIGLEGCDEILYYDLPPDKAKRPPDKAKRPPDKAKRFDCLKAAGLEMPVFLDLGFRCVADAYSPGDQRVYVLGKGKLSMLLGRLAHEHDKLRSKRQLYANDRARERLFIHERKPEFDAETVKEVQLLTANMSTVMEKAMQVRRKLYTSLASFLVSCFDYVCISDLSAASMIKQPNIARKSKRKLGLLAIGEFREAVKNACNALSQERRSLCNPSQDEASTTATLHCCKLSSFGFRFSKCIRCPYGCTQQTSEDRARQERDGAAGKTLGGKVYCEPSELAKVRLYDFVRAKNNPEADILQILDEMYDEVGKCLLEHTKTFTTFGHDTKALSAELNYAGDLKLPLFPKHQPEKVKWVETHLNKALRQRYSDRQRHVVLTNMSKRLPKKSPQKENTEGHTSYSM